MYDLPNVFQQRSSSPEIPLRALALKQRNLNAITLHTFRRKKNDISKKKF